MLPNYVSELGKPLQATNACITTGGTAASATIATNVPAPPNHTSDSKSEAPGMEDTPQEELLTPHWLVPKVLQSDQVCHTLDKGAWAATPAMCQRWKIFIGVSDSYFSPSPR